MYNNQFIIKIQKENEEWLRYENLLEIYKLNGSAFKLYIYFCTFANNEEILFSPAAIQEETGLAKNSIKNAFNELVLNDYLKKKDKDFFIFRPVQKMV